MIYVLLSKLSTVFRKTLNDLNLEIVDRRTNRHGRGLDSEVQTDLYVRDTTMNIKLQKIGAQRRIKRALQAAMELTEKEAKSLAAAADELTRLMKDDSKFFSKFDTDQVSLKYDSSRISCSVHSSHPHCSFFCSCCC